MKTRTGWIRSAAWAAGLAAAAAHAGPAGASVVCRAELDRQILPAGSAQRAVVKVTLDAPDPPRHTDRPPVNLALVIDRSGSMNGAKIRQAQEAAVQALRRLGPRDLFSVVIYNHEVETLVPAQSAANTAWIESRIREIRADGNTALFGGVSQGAAEIRRHGGERYVNRIILLSDGLANVGPSSPADLGRLGAALGKEHITVTTVGIGNGYNEDLMTQLAQNSDGNTYFVEDVVDLPRIFAAELGDVLSVVAKQVTIEVEFPDGSRPLRVIGRDGRIRGGTVQLDLNQLYGGQQKYVLIEVEVPPGAGREARDLAVARCRYENVFSLERETATARLQVRFSPLERDVTASVNRAVQTEWIKNEIAIARDRAVELADANQPRAAVAVLQEQQAALGRRARELGLGAEAEEEVKRLESDARKLNEDGMSSSLRKTFRTDSYQTRNQQQKQ